MAYGPTNKFCFIKLNFRVFVAHDSGHGPTAWVCATPRNVYNGSIREATGPKLYADGKSNIRSVATDLHIA